jgi:hypothetical protein
VSSAEIDHTKAEGFERLADAIEDAERENERLRSLLGEQLTALEKAARPFVSHADAPPRRRPDTDAPPRRAPRTGTRRRRPHEGGGTPRAAQAPHARPRPRRKRPPGVTWHITSPMLKSHKVREFQRLLNRLYRHWNIDYRITADGEYGPETRRATERAAFGLGIARRDLEHGLTAETRRKIRHPELRPAAEKARARRHREWLKRLRKRFHAGGPEQALAYARKHVGVTEHPPASNRGHLVDKWNRAVGTPLGPAAYWCGAFMNACLVAAGFLPQPWMKSCIAIEQHARGGVDGWSFHSSPKRGDLVLYTEKGVAGHVGMVEHVEGGTLVTIEGNTSRQGATSSQSNGGGVFRRRRNPRDPSFPVRGYARPPYHHR